MFGYFELYTWFEPQWIGGQRHVRRFLIKALVKENLSNFRYFKRLSREELLAHGLRIDS